MTAQPGDRVRLTCGENVIVGTVDGILNRGLDVHADGDPFGGSLWLKIDRWQVEILPPPAPEWANRRGTVVLDRRGVAWQADVDSWWSASTDHWQTYAVLAKKYGPLTLLHDPAVTA